MNRLTGLPSCAVAVNDRDPFCCRLWVVYSLWQLAEINVHWSTFPPRNTVLLPYDSRQPRQALVGDAARVVADAIDAVFAASKRGENLTLPPFPGVASANLRRGNSVCTLVARYSADRICFAVVYSLQQLQELQWQHFPDWPDDVAAIQGVARLPERSEAKKFVISGNEAAIFIGGCVLTNILRIAFQAAPEH